MYIHINIKSERGKERFEVCMFCYTYEHQESRERATHEVCKLCLTYEWEMPLNPKHEVCTWCREMKYVCYVTHINKTCHATHAFAFKGARMSHATHECVMSNIQESCHTWMSHVKYTGVMPHMNESYQIYRSHATHEWVMSNIQESCHTWMRWTMRLIPDVTSHMPDWKSTLQHIATHCNALQHTYRKYRSYCP